jgi:glycosyltransferase involved in cell wall biosynthesis
MSSLRLVLAVDKPLDPRDGGGIGTWVALLRRGLQQIGHEVAVVATAGTDVIRLPGDDVQHRARSLAALCKSEGVHAVISASSDTARLASAYLPETCRLITNVQSAKPAHVIRETRFAAGMDAIVGCSTAVTTEILRQSRDRSRVFCVPNGIAVDAESSPTPLRDRAKVVAVVGRLEIEQKRAHWLPRIHAELRRRDPEVAFEVIGGGGLTSWLSSFAGRSRGFDLLGQLPREEVALYLRTRPRVLLMTSAYEGLSFVMLEALLAGCLVVISANPRATGGEVDSRHAVVVEMGPTGFLSTRHLSSVTEALLSAISSGPGHEATVARAQKLVRESFSLEKMARGFADVSEATLNLESVRRDRAVRIPPYGRRPHEGIIASLALSAERLHLR